TLPLPSAICTQLFSRACSNTRVLPRRTLMTGSLTGGGGAAATTGGTTTGAGSAAIPVTPETVPLFTAVAVVGGASTAAVPLVVAGAAVAGRPAAILAAS